MMSTGLDDVRLSPYTPDAPTPQPHRAQWSWALGAFAVILAANLFQDRYLFWDSYLDLAAGRVIVQGGIPHHEIFTVAGQGRAWVDQQWLSHLATYTSWRVAGYPGVALLSSAAVASAFGLLTGLMLSRGAHPQRALMWTGAAYVVCLGNTVVRAQALAYPLWVLLLWGLTAEWGRSTLSRRAWLAIPLLVLWANMHGSALLAAAFVALAAAVRAVISHRQGRSSASYAVLALGAALSPLATPYGLGVVHYYTSLIGNPVIKQYILEWSPPSFGDPVSLGFIALLMATCIVVGYAAARHDLRIGGQLALVAFTALIATQAVRYAPWFAFTATAFDAERLARLRPPPPDVPKRIVRAAAVAVAAFLAVTLAIVAGTSDSRFESLQPQRAMAAAEAYAMAHPDARILADDTSSSAMLWKYPSLYGRVGFDARLEQFPQAELRGWFRYMAVAGPDWLRATDGYDVLVASNRDHPLLVRRLARLRGWHTLERDSDGIAVARGAG